MLYDIGVKNDFTNFKDRLEQGPSALFSSESCRGCDK